MKAAIPQIDWILSSKVFLHSWGHRKQRVWNRAGCRILTFLVTAVGAIKIGPSSGFANPAFVVSDPTSSTATGMSAILSWNSPRFRRVSQRSWVRATEHVRDTGCDKPQRPRRST